MKRIAIIGAGLTGLTAGFYLKKAGIPFVIFEADNRVGGVIKTEAKDGFLFERGPNSGVLSNLETVHLFEALEGCKMTVASEQAKARWIWKNNRWEALPSGLISAIKTPLFTMRDKLKVLKEPFTKKGTNPNENLASMVKRRLGQSFLDYAIDPFISGVYAGDTEYLIPKYALPKLYNLEQKYGSFIKGAIKKAKDTPPEEKAKVSKQIFSTNRGLQGLTDSLAESIGESNIKLDQKDLVINKTDSGYSINKEIFSDVFSSVPADKLNDLMPFLQAEETQAIRQLKYAKIIEVAVGFKQWKGIALNAFGGLLPSKEQRNILGVLFMSSLFKNRAPEQGALLAVFMGGIKKEYLLDLPDIEIKKIVANELSELFHLNDFSPDLFEITRYQKAIAQYGIDSKQRFEAIKNIEKKHKGLHLGGSIIGGIGIPDRIKQGFAFADTVDRR